MFKAVRFKGKLYSLDVVNKVYIYKDSDGVKHTFHKDYYEAFFNCKVPKGHLVIHKDGDKTNNHIDNLECVSYRELNAMYPHLYKELRGKHAMFT